MPPILFWAALSAGAAAVVMTVAVAHGVVVGEIGDDGMGPTFEPGDTIWVDRMSPHLIDYRAGEVVGVRASRYLPHGALMRIVVRPHSARSPSIADDLREDEYVAHPVGEGHDTAVVVIQRENITGRVIVRVAPVHRLEWRPGAE